MKPIKRLQLGKKGLSESFIGHVRKVFEKEKLLKISILKSATRSSAEAEEIGKELINKLGRNYSYKRVGFVLTVMKFRKNIGV